MFPLTLFVPADFNPLGIMSIVAVIAWIGGIISAFYMLLQLNTGYTALGAFLFGMYPNVGLGYALIPTSDSDIIGRLWLMLSVLFYLQNRKWLTVFMLALALITHKVLWVNVLIIALIALYQRRLSLIHIIMSGVPLGIYTLWGAAFHGNLLWILNRTFDHARVNARDIRAFFSVFDTILGRFANGGITNILVGGIVLVIVFVAIFLLFSRVWPGQPILLAFIVPSLIVSAVMAVASSMVVIRFSPFLLIPLWLHLFPDEKPRWKFLTHPIIAVTITGACLASQVFFLFYIQRFFGQLN